MTALVITPDATPNSLVLTPGGGFFDPTFFDPAFFDTGSAVQAITITPDPSSSGLTITPD